MEKCEITISKGNYVDSVKGGCEFTSVSYWAKDEGGSSPCDNEKEVEEKIKEFHKRITAKGYKPIIVDKRIKITQKTLF